MTEQEIQEEIIKKLKKEYFLIPKHNWIMFLGGLTGFIVLATYSSYQGAISAVQTTGSKIAINEINKAKNEAIANNKEIKKFAIDIKSGVFQKDMIKTLKADQDFLSKVKGDRGPKGERGLKGEKGEKGNQGVKGDSFISSSTSGQHLYFKNSNQKNVVFIGTSTTKKGLIVLYDSYGNEVVKITSSGICFINKSPSCYSNLKDLGDNG